MQIRPCIDIHNGKVKQIVGSTLRDQQGAREGMALENFVADKDAAYYASLYKEMGLCGGHIILLNSAREEAYQADLAQARAALSAYQGGMQIGGGITAESAPSSHVIVTSYVFRDGKLDEDALKKMLRAVGKQRLVLDLSCRKREDGRYAVVTDRWQKFTSYTICEENLDRLSERCDEFLIHPYDRRLAEEERLSRHLCGRRAYVCRPCAHRRPVAGTDRCYRWQRTLFVRRRFGSCRFTAKGRRVARALNRPPACQTNMDILK